MIWLIYHMIFDIILWSCWKCLHLLFQSPSNVHSSRYWTHMITFTCIQSSEWCNIYRIYSHFLIHVQKQTEKKRRYYSVVGCRSAWFITGLRLVNLFFCFPYTICSECTFEYSKGHYKRGEWNEIIFIFHQPVT